MRRFAALYLALDASTRTSAKVAALRAYFADAPPRDAAWAAFLLAGKRTGRALSSRRLRDWVADEAGLPAWLVEESYAAVGDLSETLALLLPPPTEAGELSLADVVDRFITPLPAMSESEQRDAVRSAWRTLPEGQRFLFHKLISGTFRVGVSRGLLVRSLALHAGVDEAVMQHRMTAPWRPTADDFARLLDGTADDAAAVPYPFMLAHPLQEPLESLGPAAEWQREWKWDGIRAQVIRRDARTFVWSRGELPVGQAFPELRTLAAAWPDGTVLDGEILAWDERADRPLPFASLQTRLNRKDFQPQLFGETPVIFLAYDLLEWAGTDLRERPLSDRRATLESIATTLGVRLSPTVDASDWPAAISAMASSRERGVEGLMLKRRDSAYAAGRVTGLWWKLKTTPFTIDAVLVAAQPGSGRRAGLYTDYTFAVRDESQPPGSAKSLAVIAKAYSGLTDAEIAEVDRFVRANTTARFGPVRAVVPQLVFELAFDGIAESKRHKSGVALRFPRIARWRQDKPAGEIDTLATLRGRLNHG